MKLPIVSCYSENFPVDFIDKVTKILRETGEMVSIARMAKAYLEQ